MMSGQSITDPGGQIKISFGYHCNNSTDDSGEESDGIDVRPGSKLRRANGSFSCLSGAALSANATLANTNICNGLFGAEILPALDSPTSFRRIPSSPSFSKLDLLSSSFQSSLSNLSCSPSSPSDLAEDNSSSLRSTSAPSRCESFLNATEVKVAGGAAGEDRVQAVCSEENDSLFCGIYDGFNGRDAADFLAGTLYETIRHYVGLLDLELERESKVSHHEMDNRPDLVSIGSCVLVVLLLGKNMYVLNAGDSRAVLATYGKGIGANSDGRLQAVQLTVSHTVDDESERIQLLKNHPDDPSTIVGGKVKGKLKVTRALGVGYLKKNSMNDALMGILRVRNLVSPPYISVQPSLAVHEISSSDHFVVLGSDGLFDFFNNDDVVKLVHSYIQRYPFGDPAKFLVEQLVMRAADCAGFSKEELMSIPAGRRRKYHDDVTVIVIILGMNKRTSKASTRL